jgi:imidazolonepropionase-like amidohydrolase
VNAAAARGRRVAVHAYPARAIRVACEVGVATIEHAVDMDEAAIEAIRRAGAAIVPTHAVYEYMAENRSGNYPQLAPIAQRVLERKTAPLEAAITAGVTVGVGTDCGRHYPYDGIAREMELLEAAGMSREGVLLAATRGNADILGVAARVGKLVPGMAADIILLGSNPLDRLAALRDVRRVVQGGTVHDPATLRL